MKEGLNVAERFGGDDAGKRHLQAVSSPDAAASNADLSGVKPANAANERLTLVIDQLPHAAYMVNHKFEVTWFNEQARLEIPGFMGELPPHTDDRSIFRMVLTESADELSDNALAMLRLNLALAKERMNLPAIIQPLRGVSGSRAQ